MPHKPFRALSAERKPRRWHIFRLSKSARGLAQSKTLARVTELRTFRQVLECGGPPPLWNLLDRHFTATHDPAQSGTTDVTIQRLTITRPSTLDPRHLPKCHTPGGKGRQGLELEAEIRGQKSKAGNGIKAEVRRLMSEIGRLTAGLWPPASALHPCPQNPLLHPGGIIAWMSNERGSRNSETWERQSRLSGRSLGEGRSRRHVNQGRALLPLYSINTSVTMYARHR
jgi:hypothetical protein